jgi:uncharacterized protein (DUF427 family)
MAARVAARLRTESNVSVESVKGRLGEFRVTVDGRDVVKTARYWYPNPDTVVATVRHALAASRA